MNATRRVARAAAVAAGIAATSCLDASGLASGTVRLGLYPVFEGAAAHEGRDGTATDVDSFVVIVANPPRADTIVRRLAPGQDTLFIELEIELLQALDTLNVQFRGYNSLNGLLLYSGTLSVAVSPGVTIPDRPVGASYVGPGQGLRSLSVIPNAAGIRPNETVQLAYEGRDTAGILMPDDSVPVRYSTSDRAVAEVTNAGLVTARGLGTAQVFVTALANSAIEDTAVITVSNAPPPLIGLQPGSLTVPDTVATTDPPAVTVQVVNTGGGTLAGLSLGAIQYGAGGSGWLQASLSGAAAPATITLTLAKGSLAAGTYTATVPVTASGVANSPQNLTVSYQISVALIASVRLTPGFSVMRPTETQTLQVVARDAGGTQVPATGATFTSRSTGVATVNPTTGVVTAVGPGTAVLVGAVGTIADSVVVAVAATGVAVASAVGDARAFDEARVGDTVRVLVAVNLRGVAPERLGSYNAQLDWTPATLRYVRTDVVAGGFAAPTVNSGNATSGQLRFGAADANGHAGPDVGLVTVIFVANAAGSTALTLTLTDLSTALTFVQLLPNNALVHSGRVRVQ